ncbi:uncharacterized protein E0L32_005104 [Thyridium curvatum]|uniref:Uncharacterized protein n=1 Tax=Thyridium curvatum TaxID=1093900 RepID=A0A507BBF7_9PEZI|nr:uncharacterized protein E0L32_005104 [Thyridium curvatum]TPX14709.1 hypothetical protein E0L32_005104 [Thyridium curvatum]
MNDVSYYNVSREVFPPVRELDFSKDCEVFGEWVATVVAPDPWDARFQQGGAVSVVWRFMMSALDDEWRHPHGPDLAPLQFYNQLSQWYFEQWYWRIVRRIDNDTLEYETNPDFVLAAWDVPQSRCPEQYCKAIAQTGNTDISGIGEAVMADTPRQIHTAYYVEAVLATMYLVAFTVWRLREHLRKRASRRGGGGGGDGHQKHRRPLTGPNSGWAGRILDAFRATVSSFLSMAMLLSLVMLIAAIKTAAQKSQIRRIPELSRDVPNGSALYDISLSLLASTFSVFPVMLIYALMRHTGGGKEEGHRQWMSRAVLALLWALGVAEMYLAPRGELDYDYRHSGVGQFDCDVRGGQRHWRGIKAGQWMVVGAPLLWVALAAFVVTGFGIPGVADYAWVRRWRAAWRLAVAWLNLLLMWGVLAYFTYLRHSITATAGGDRGADQSGRWLFGQILALSTWAPTVAEWFYVLFFGMKEAWSTKMPEGYEAVRRRDNNDGPGSSGGGTPGAADMESESKYDAAMGAYYYGSSSSSNSRRESDQQQLLHGAAGPAVIAVGSSSPMVPEPQAAVGSVPPPYQTPMVTWDAATNSWKAVSDDSRAASATWQHPDGVPSNWQHQSPQQQQQQQQGQNRREGTPWDQWESTGW